MCLGTSMPCPTKHGGIFVSKAVALMCFCVFSSMHLYLQGIPLQIFSAHMSSATLGVTVVHNGASQNGIVIIACRFLFYTFVH